MTDRLVPRQYLVRAKGPETGDTATLEVEPQDKQAAFSFSAGQFSMLYAFGAGEIPISISGNPRARERHSYTVRAVGPISRQITELRPGEVVGVRGPFGSSWPLAEARGKHLLLLAGGLGLAPLRSVIFEVLADVGAYQSLTLLYGARSAAEMLFKEQLEQWSADFDVRLIVDVGVPGWKGEVGVVTKLLKQLPLSPEETAVFMCGPEVMMRFCIGELRSSGWPPDAIYLSMERNMKCAVGICGRCQFGSEFICKDGPVFAYDRIQSFLDTREL